MKVIIKIGVALFLLGASFIGGIMWAHSQEQNIISDIEDAALKACQIKVNAIKKTCK